MDKKKEFKMPTGYAGITHEMSEFYEPVPPVVTPGTDLKGGQKNLRKIFVKNEFYYFKNNFQKIFAYLKNFIICVYIIYYQKFLSNFHTFMIRNL